jgi:hypothetical protein
MDETHARDDDRNDDDGSLEGPDIETPTGDGDGTLKPRGLGHEGTIPSDPSGVAAGHTVEQSNFNPEEDPAPPA